MMGIPFEAGTVRVARLQAALRVIKSLLSGQKASATDHGYAIAEAQISPLPAQRPHLSILVAGARRRLLQLAAQEADIIALGITPTAG
jgi:alkanesulfonate monooxygenase SsuD/methylene tetrahydromethanopterin reductase-like flavin-dependent oxidoreductase (luciferase family)